MSLKKAIALCIFPLLLVSGCTGFLDELTGANKNNSDAQSQPEPVISPTENPYTTPIVKTGFLQGKITIGPLCAIETFPPKPWCVPTLKTFLANPIHAYTKNSGEREKTTTFFGDKSGEFKIELPAGAYLLSNREKDQLFAGPGTFMQTVEIKPGQPTTISIDIDTGIR